MAKIKRKTVEVGTLLYRVNYFLKNDRSTADEREVMCTFIEGVLHDTGNYRGFKFLDVEHVTDDDGLIVDSIIPDETARRYY